MKIKLVTDSTAYIPEELIHKYDIKVVSLSVAFKTESFKEVDIDKETFYKKMEDSKEIPTSSQPAFQELYDVFEKQIELGNAVVATFLSSDMSGTYSTAHVIKEMIIEKYPAARIEIVDSKSNCMQLGYAVLEGAYAIEKGDSLEKVVEAVKNNVKRSRFLFVPDGLEYLRKGGRIGEASALIGKIFQIHPILTVRDGKTDIYDKVRTKKRAVGCIIDKLMEDVDKFGIGDVMVHHINCESEAIELAEKIKEKLSRSVEVQSIGPVIGLHVGPGTVGVVYYTEKELI